MQGKKSEACLVGLHKAFGLVYSVSAVALALMLPYRPQAGATFIIGRVRYQKICHTRFYEPPL